MLKSLKNFEFSKKVYIFASYNNFKQKKMDRNFELAAKGWLRQYTADIKGKVESLLDENESTPEELADVINVDVEEIYDILEGNGDNISVETLIKVFMVLGLAIEIKPIEQTPLGGYDNVNPHVEREPQFERRSPQPSPFMRQPVGMPHGFDNIPPHVREEMDREFERRHPMPHVAPTPPRPNGGLSGVTSPFAAKSREELVNIIRKHLWDTEIDTNTAPKEALVRFLNEKDRRKKEFAQTEELERDPRVASFVKNMKKTIKENPQFRAYMKNFLGELDNEE